ncbi:MAG: glutathione S-transferase N-terminal domain-containing protein [Litoreibacter sp.]
MEKNVKLWGRATSINVQKVAWVVAELELPCTRIDAGGAFGGLDDPSYVALNPNKRVPTLIDGEIALWESNAIARHLVNAYGKSTPLAHKNAQAQAQADMWMEWFQNNIYANFIALFYQEVRLPPSQRDGIKRDRALDALCKSLDLFDANLDDREYILGDQLTLGDIPTGSCLYRFFTMDIQRPQFRNLERYYDNLVNRQSYRNAVMIDYSTLRGSD